MRIVRAYMSAEDKTIYAVQHDAVYREIEDPFAGDIVYTGQTYDQSILTLLAPCQPGKVVCVGINYAEHAGELSFDLPDEPLIFIKPSTTVIGPDDAIVYPPQTKSLDFEAELAVVIGKTCKNVEQMSVSQYVLGYTCLNDVTARDLQKKDGQWTRAKGFDTFCPIGPWIETEFDWRDVSVMSRLNGQVKQNGRTSQMIFKVDALIAYISEIMTMEPGDVIATGTPSGIGPMQVGDRIEIEVGGLGILQNYIA